MRKSKDRNYNIDFLRGIATLWIIIIHTVFWSGANYLPNWFVNLFLLLDVPAFMFIAGLSYNYTNSIIKNIKGILNQWLKWCFFLIFYAILLLIFRKTFGFNDILNWIFYVIPAETPLPVVPGSLWFITMYIKVTLLCSCIISLINYFVKEDKIRLQYLISVIFLLILIFGNSSSSKEKLIISTYTSFYSIIYLLGYISFKFKIDFKQVVLYSSINLFALIGTFISNKYTLSDFQTVKFPPSIPYIFVAAFSIIIYWYLKDKLNIDKSNIVNYVGKNAILYYFAQGISSSVLIKIIPHLLHINHVALFIIALIINLLLANIGAIILEKSYKFMAHKIKLEKIKRIILPKGFGL